MHVCGNIGYSTVASILDSHSERLERPGFNSRYPNKFAFCYFSSGPLALRASSRPSLRV